MSGTVMHRPGKKIMGVIRYAMPRRRRLDEPVAVPVRQPRYLVQMPTVPQALLVPPIIRSDGNPPMPL